MFCKIAVSENPFHLCAMKDDLTFNERKAWAKLLYTRHGKTYKDTALEVNADEPTVRFWAESDSWDNVKRSLLISKTAQLERLYIGLEALDKKAREDNEVTTKDIDQTIKYTTAIKNLESDTCITYIIHVAELFTAWLLRRDVDLAHIVTREFDAFVDSIPAS